MLATALRRGAPLLARLPPAPRAAPLDMACRLLGAAATGCAAPPALWRGFAGAPAPADASPPVKRPRGRVRTVPFGPKGPPRGWKKRRAKAAAAPPKKAAPPPPPPPPPVRPLPAWKADRARALAALFAPLPVTYGKQGPVRLPPGPERDARRAARRQRTVAARAAARIKHDAAAVNDEDAPSPIDSTPGLETTGTPCVGFAPPRVAAARGSTRTPPPPAPTAPAAASAADVAAATAVLASAVPPGALKRARAAFAGPGEAASPRRPPLPVAAHLAGTIAAFLAAGGTRDAVASLASREPGALARPDAGAALADLMRALRRAGGVAPGTAAAMVASHPRLATAANPGAAARAAVAYLRSLGLSRADVAAALVRVPALAGAPVRGLGGVASTVAALSGAAGLRGPHLAAALVGCPGLALVKPAAVAARARFARDALGADVAALAGCPSVLVRPLSVVGGRLAAARAAGRWGGEGGLPLAALGAWNATRFADALGSTRAELAGTVDTWFRTEEGRRWTTLEAVGKEPNGV